MTQEGGEGLDGLMRARKNSLYGILNGIDYDEFNPETDPYIEANFTSKNVMSVKKKDKAALQKELGLPVREDAFVIGVVSRMTEQKGFDLISYILDDMVTKLDVQLVILGTGENKYENVFHHFHSQYPDKVSAYIGYSEARAHKIYASADAFLMPSLFEPCGLSQMMSMRYGTIPIVRETGGLKDTVEAYNEYENSGTGFSFCNFNADDKCKPRRSSAGVILWLADQLFCTSSIKVCMVGKNFIICKLCLVDFMNDLCIVFKFVGVTCINRY